jgi:hypothetical protein
MYGQMVLYPWGHTYTASPDAAEQGDVAGKVAAAIECVAGAKHNFGPGAATIYPTSGDITDWAYGQMGITHVQTIEGRDLGLNGFVAPPDLIVPAGRELLSGLVVGAQYIREPASADLLPAAFCGSSPPDAPFLPGACGTDCWLCGFNGCR